VKAMGAWGTEPYANDTAADWFGNNLSDKPLPEAIGEGLNSRYEEVVRAAAFLLERVGYGYVYPYKLREGHLSLAIERLSAMLGSSWADDWDKPDEARAALRRQIDGLRVRLDRADETVLGRLIQEQQQAPPPVEFTSEQFWGMIAEAVQRQADLNPAKNEWKVLAEAIEGRNTDG